MILPFVNGINHRIDLIIGKVTADNDLKIINGPSYIAVIHIRQNVVIYPVDVLHIELAGIFFEKRFRCFQRSRKSVYGDAVLRLAVAVLRSDFCGVQKNPAIDLRALIFTGIPCGENRRIDCFCLKRFRQSISDSVYSQKINSETFKLVVDAETGIVLEFVGYDDLGNETESIKTTDISIIKNTNGGSTDIAAFVDASLDNREVYKDIERTDFLDTDYVKRSAVSTTSISKTIDNDTVDSDCYNSREGFLAYLNDSNYYNKDMRRTNSNSDTHYYGWHCNTVLDHEADDYIRVSLKVYLYSSTSKDPAASYGVYTVGMVGDSIFGMCTMDQATAPNGWNSFSRRWCLGNAGSITGIEMSPSGKGSTYTGADAVSYTISIA